MYNISTDFCLAGISACVQHQHQYLSGLLSDYRTDEHVNRIISINQIDIDAEKVTESAPYPDAYLESLAFYRKFCNAVANDGVIMFHSCAVVCEEKAYLFAAPSGTGKSTHGDLWCRVYGEKVSILNGDKPLIRFIDGVPYVYGTPFDGKERIGYNGRAEIAGICFIRQSPDNHISSITPSDAFGRAYLQTYKPSDTEICRKIIDVMIRLISSVPLYSMGCNISSEAAELSFNTMKRPQ